MLWKILYAMREEKKNIKNDYWTIMNSAADDSSIRLCRCENIRKYGEREASEKSPCAVQCF